MFLWFDIFGSRGLCRFQSAIFSKCPGTFFSDPTAEFLGRQTSKNERNWEKLKQTNGLEFSGSTRFNLKVWEIDVLSWFQALVQTLWDWYGGNPLGTYQWTNVDHLDQTTDLTKSDPRNGPSRSVPRPLKKLTSHGQFWENPSQAT